METSLPYNFITKDGIFGGKNLNLAINTELRYIFMMNATVRITGKNYLLSFDNFVQSEIKINQINLLLTELFCTRPRLNTYHS